MTADLVLPVHSISAQEVECSVRHTVPKDGETIEEIINLDVVLKEGHSVNWYRRPPEDCPFARGNKIIDIHFKNGSILCIKLPLETTDEQVKKYLEPLSRHAK